MDAFLRFLTFFEIFDGRRFNSGKASMLVHFKCVLSFASFVSFPSFVPFPSFASFFNILSFAFFNSVVKDCRLNSISAVLEVFFLFVFDSSVREALVSHFSSFSYNAISPSTILSV